MKTLLSLAGAFALAASTFAQPSSAPPPPPGTVDLAPWNTLAIQEGGRRKPLGTFGHEALVRLHGRDPLRAADSTRWTGGEFAFSLLFATREWSAEPLILVAYKPLVGQLGLDPSRKHFSREELRATEATLLRLSQEAAALRQAAQPVPRTDQEAQNVLGRIQLFDAMHSSAAFLIAPPPAGALPGAPWLTVDAMAAAYPPATAGPILEDLRRLNQSYHAGDSDSFAEAGRRLLTDLRGLNPAAYPADAELARETLYNRLQPHSAAMWCYGAALVCIAAAASSGWRRPLGWIGVGLTLAGLGFQVFGLVLRVMITGRAPVTNMYESVVWVAMGVTLFGLIFYAVYRSRTMLLAALPLAFLCLLLVRSLPIAMPSRMDPLVPVLRDNFWLTVHVLTITISYAAFALALGFGHAILWRYIRRPDRMQAGSQLHAWLYRMLMLGILLLATGTILGGVWANYSWGRFWGWDPKETWALIALLLYIVALHGRLAGWWGDFGVAVASIVCFSGIIMAWYGVNYVLGAGLHSYGFGVGGEGYILAFLGAEALYVAVAIVRHARARRLPYAPLPVEDAEPAAAPR